jgi:hypothetical protein
VEVVDMVSGYTIFAWAQVCCSSRSAGGDGNFECWMVAKCSSRSVGVSPTWVHFKSGRLAHAP